MIDKTKPGYIGNHGRQDREYDNTLANYAEMTPVRRTVLESVCILVGVLLGLFRRKI